MRRKTPSDTIWHPFESALSIVEADIEWWFRGHEAIPWADLLLNPRRLRGSDFLMRWSQGQWSEHRLMEAINATDRYYALPYGPSGVAPDEPRAFELYFERLEAAGLGQIKRPDLLIFQQARKPDTDRLVAKLGGQQELPFIPEDRAEIRQLLNLAIIAVECENSLWRAKKMPDFEAQLRPQKRLGGKPGLKKNAVLPTITIKNEDREPLRKWQQACSVPIHIWQSFYDLVFGISFDEAERLIEEGAILPREQIFQAPNGATQKKAIYFMYHHYAYPVGEMKEEPALRADYIEDKNGHILPYVRFDGGTVAIELEALKVLDTIAAQAKRG